MQQHHKVRETHAQCSRLMSGLCPEGDQSAFMKTMDAKAPDITKLTGKLKEQLPVLNVLASAAGGADAFPGFALDDHAPATESKLTFYVCLWTAMIYFTDTATWSSSAAGKAKLSSLRSVVRAVDDDPKLLAVESALQVGMFQQIRTDLKMPFKLPVATQSQPAAVAAASGQQQTSGPGETAVQAATVGVPRAPEVALAPSSAAATPHGVGLGTVAAGAALASASFETAEAADAAAPRSPRVDAAGALNDAPGQAQAGVGLCPDVASAGAADQPAQMDADEIFNDIFGDKAVAAEGGGGVPLGGDAEVAPVPAGSGGCPFVGDPETPPLRYEPGRTFETLQETRMESLDAPVATAVQTTGNHPASSQSDTESATKDSPPLACEAHSAVGTAAAASSSQVARAPEPGTPSVLTDAQLQQWANAANASLGTVESSTLPEVDSHLQPATDPASGLALSRRRPAWNFLPQPKRARVAEVQEPAEASLEVPPPTARKSEPAAPRAQAPAPRRPRRPVPKSGDLSTFGLVARPPPAPPTRPAGQPPQPRAPKGPKGKGKAQGPSGEAASGLPGKAGTLLQRVHSHAARTGSGKAAAVPRPQQ